MATALKPRPAGLAPDLITVLALFKRTTCWLKPNEIAQMTGLSEERAALAVSELHVEGLIAPAFWGLTKAGKGYG